MNQKIVYYERYLKKYTKKLRCGMTPSERNLWYKFLRHQTPQRYRQKPLGPYIVDFFCPSAALVIEVDGYGHYQDEMQEKDRVRDQYLKTIGIKVLRYTNREVNRQLDAVSQSILWHMGHT